MTQPSMLIILVPLLSICVSFDKRFFLKEGGGGRGGEMSIYVILR